MATPRKRAAKPQQSQRDRLLGRPRPSVRYPLLVDPEGAEALRPDLEAAQRALRHAIMREDDDAKRRAERRLKAVRDRLERCYEMVLLQALPPDELEALGAAHPPTAEQMDAARRERDEAQRRNEEPPPWPVVNDATYYPELLARCAVEAGMTADDWTKLLSERVSEGERRGLRMAVMSVNASERAAEAMVLPKGWMTTNS